MKIEGPVTAIASLTDDKKLALTKALYVVIVYGPGNTCLTLVLVDRAERNSSIYDINNAIDTPEEIVRVQME